MVVEARAVTSSVINGRTVGRSTRFSREGDREIQLNEEDWKYQEAEDGCLLYEGT